jgi:hypothetical protein
VFVALVIQHAVRISHIVMCGLSGSTIFFPHLINGTIVEKKMYAERKMCFFLSFTAFV